MKQKVFIFLCFMLFALPSYAWNAMGHRIIGAIAYTNLTPQAKNKVNSLIDYLADAYPYSSNFQTANSWADTLRQDGVELFNHWHFYNQPYSVDNTPIHPPDSENLVWAINHIDNILTSPHSNQFEKAFFLRFLLHFVGDAHQPLHCINRFSKAFPEGDQGGNLFLLPLNNYDNLHAYWDAGLGIFNEHCGFSSSKSRRAECLSQKIMAAYPPSYFGAKIQDLNPEDWTQESFMLAKNFVYQTPENKHPSAAYIQQGQQIVQQQIALAGYRLAALLNKIFG